MLRVGLTGGIGSGKTTVAELFAARGVPVIDTDRIARDIVVPDSPLLADICNIFGPDILSADGTLNRGHLRRIIFSDDTKRRQLEGLLHPAIRAIAESEIARLNTSYCLVVVPLLLEKGWQALVDRILVVDTPIEQQVSRTQQRDGLSAEEVHAIIAAQFTRDRRLTLADDVIVNNAGMAQLEQQVELLHQRYLELSSHRLG